MSIISVPNLKEMETWEGYDLNIFVICCGEEKCEENQAIFRNKYLEFIIF